MYCDADRLMDISKRVNGLCLKGIYPDYAHGIIYMYFGDTVKMEILAIKNNYYAGMYLLTDAKQKGEA